MLVQGDRRRSRPSAGRHRRPPTRLPKSGSHPKLSPPDDAIVAGRCRAIALRDVRPRASPCAAAIRCRSAPWVVRPSHPATILRCDPLIKPSTRNLEPPTLQKPTDLFWVHGLLSEAKAAPSE